MSEIIRPSRRGFFGFVGALVAAPAIVRSDSLMRIVGVHPRADAVFSGLFVDETYVVNSNILLTLNQITRKAIRQWKNSNLFMQNIEGEYNRVFSIDDVKIGTVLRIRQPLEEATAKQIPKWAQHNFA